jgi:diacylglycerol kinase (ATP)
METPDITPAAEKTVIVEPLKATGLMRLIRAMGYSWQGIKAAAVHEAAFRQELLGLFVSIPVLLLLPFALIWKAWILSSFFLILIVELLNSSVEWVVDYISLEKHPFAKRAKDMASAAVLLSLINCGCAWLFALMSLC